MIQKTRRRGITGHEMYAIRFLETDSVDSQSVPCLTSHFSLLPSLFKCSNVLASQGENKNFYSDRAPDIDNLSNILICSILAMTRRKAEGELSDESVDLCTSEQREG